MTSEEAAAITVTRDTLMREFADGDIAVRFIVAASDVEGFYKAFPEIGQAVFVATPDGAVEAVRDTLQGEYRDGSLAVKIKIAPKDKVAFRRLLPHPKMEAVLAAEEPARGRQAMLDSSVADAPKYGAEARTLRQHVAFMLNPKVWHAVGSDDAYLSWLRTMPCAHCTWKPHYEMNRFVSCEPAHVRRVASGAGTGIKPVYSAIPLCPTRPGVEGCHARQHREGEGFLGGQEKVDRLRVKYVAAWVWATLKETLSYAHWNQLPPEVLYAWAADHGLVEYLPKCYLPTE